MFEQLFEIVEEVVRDYQTYVAMNLPASKEQSDSLEADDLSFQLLLIAIKLTERIGRLRHAQCARKHCAHV